MQDIKLIVLDEKGKVMLGVTAKGSVSVALVKKRICEKCGCDAARFRLRSGRHVLVDDDRVYNTFRDYDPAIQPFVVCFEPRHNISSWLLLVSMCFIFIGGLAACATGFALHLLVIIPTFMISLLSFGGLKRVSVKNANPSSRIFAPVPGKDVSVEKAGQFEFFRDKSLRWSDWIGNTEVLKYFQQLVQRFEEEAGERSTFDPAIGFLSILLHGPMGTGKTRAVEIFANEVARMAKVFFLSGKSYRRPNYGESEQLLAGLWETAHLESVKTGIPSFIFMDEVESILPAQQDGQADPAGLQTLNQIIQLCSTYEKTVVIIGGTNFPMKIAVNGLSRFKQKVFVGLPIDSERICLLGLYCKKFSKVSLSEKDYAEVAAKTALWSGRELQALANEARSLSRVEGVPHWKAPLELKHFQEALRYMKTTCTPEIAASFKDVFTPQQSSKDDYAGMSNQIQETIKKRNQ